MSIHTIGRERLGKRDVLHQGLCPFTKDEIRACHGRNPCLTHNTAFPLLPPSLNPNRALHISNPRAIGSPRFHTDCPVSFFKEIRRQRNDIQHLHQPFLRRTRRICAILQDAYQIVSAELFLLRGRRCSVQRSGRSKTRIFAKVYVQVSSQPQY